MPKIVKRKIWPYISVAVLIAAIGTILLQVTRAATYTSTAHVATAALSGNASVQSAAGASNTNVVRFGGPKLIPLSFSSPPYQQKGPLLGNQYIMKFNEWNSTRPVTMTSSGGADFHIKSSSLNIPIGGAPSGYWQVHKGSSWGAKTINNGAPFPYLASGVKPGQVTTTANCYSAGVTGAYNIAYDIWFNGSSTASNNQSAPYLEMMIWLKHTPGANPIGSIKASNVQIGTNRYNVWFGGTPKSRSTVSYELATHSNTYSSDLYPLIQDAIARGYMPGSWYMLDVELGFEIWNGGAGLGCSNFSIIAQ
jgi:hypothetical protein